MKIAFFTECYHPITNGVIISVDTFSTQLKNLGHQTYVFAPYIANCSDNKNSVCRFPSLPLPAKTLYRLTIPYSRKVFATFKEIAPDIVHTNHPFITGHLGEYLAKKHKLPLVFTYHTLLAEYTHYIPFNQKFCKNTMVWVSRSYSNKADLVIAPSPKAKELLLSYGVKKDIEVIPTGIDFSKLVVNHPENVRKKYNINQDDTLLINVGRLTKEKNIYFLLEIFQHIHRENPQTHLIVIGEGNEEAKLRNYSQKLGIADCVTFPGLVPHEEIADFYTAADMFVFTSLTETQGIVILEAMACGLPVVAIDAGGVGGIIKDGETGLLTKNDKADFCAKISPLLTNPSARKKMGDCAKKESQDYSAYQQAKRLEQCYFRLTAINSTRKDD